jgi:hypothetical protein
MSPEVSKHAFTQSLEGGRPMTRRFSLRRTGTLLLAAGLMFALAGDRGITAIPLGIDPLEVLNLQVKPNVIIALDTSGSMEDTPYVASSYGGDHQRSKMWQAKQVLKAVFQENEDKASFLFGVYRYSSDANPVANMNLRVNGTPNRFVYSTQSWAGGTYANPACTVDPASCPSPNPANVTLPDEGPGASMRSRNLYLGSLYAFQWIQDANTDNPYNHVSNDTLVFNEGGLTCTVKVAHGFYTSGDALAAAIQTAMNSCGGRANTYSVWYGVAPGTAVSVSVTSLTRNRRTATATTATAHGFSTGDSITIAGATPSGYNGVYTITVTSSTTFTFPVANTLATPASGTITASKIQMQGTANRFSFAGSGTNFTLQWGNAATTLQGVLNLAGTGNQNVSGTWTQSTDPRINLLARTTGNSWNETYDPDGPSTTLVPALDKPSPTRPVTTYNLDAQKYWNGETVYVDDGGNACDIVPGSPTNPPTVTLKRTTDCANGAGSADDANVAVFTWGGGKVGSGAGTCQGFDAKVPLIPCDQLTPSQYDGIAPYLENQLPLDDGSVDPAKAGTIKGYTEANDGTGAVTHDPDRGGVIASSNTPLAQTADDVRVLFGGATGLWNAGQSAPKPVLDPIKNHLSPKEKTILILVTDGNQNCSPFTGEGEDDARGAAAATQQLYDPNTTAAKGNGTGAGTVNADGTINGDPAASVTTYVVAYGAGASKNYSDWIAWGGSGMQIPFTSVSGHYQWTRQPTQADRDQCLTCIDSFLAPDPDTLKSVLEKVINQGATSGEFTAQQSLTDSIYELSGDVAQGSAPAAWSPMNPRNRYDPLAPNRISASFTLPLFTGQIKAYTQGGPDALAIPAATCRDPVDNPPKGPGPEDTPGTACLRWSANDKLVTRVSTGMTAACPAVGSNGNNAGRCSFAKLVGTATDANLSTAAIKRRVYTTSQNGVFGPTVTQLVAGQSPYRVALWPPQSTSIPKAVAPTNDTSEGLFDGELGLPLDTVADYSAAFLDLRTTFKACMGSSLPASCPAMTATSGTLAQMKRARREAREMILAFVAGAEVVKDSTGYPTRVSSASTGYAVGDILYARRSSILAESTLATPAVVSPPQAELPEEGAWQTEYTLYRDGPRDYTNAAYGTDGESEVTPGLVRAGFGLRNPDMDGLNQVAGSVQGRIFYRNDSRSMKPVMSVLYAGTNLALHAFRAGPNVATSAGAGLDYGDQITGPACVPSATVECGGEELWAFVPYDQLGKLNARYVDNPQKRDPHDYVIARAIRFSDVFVPEPGTAEDPRGTSEARSVNGVALGPIEGVWRKVMFVGRGKGGKYLTAIDVTAPGMFTDLTTSSSIVGPIILWNRGNPDTSNGKLQGQAGATLNYDQDNYNAYRKMGETWSVPAVAYVGRTLARADDPTRKVTATTRKAKGTDFVLYVGSGYGDPGEGTTFYSLDPLTGDVITSVDVEQAVANSYPELQRSGMAYTNAIVANPIVFNVSRFVYAPGGVPSPNVAATPAGRVYVADLYGRFWKFLVAAPDVPLPGADLGADQPVAVAASALGLPPNDPHAIPYVYVTSGDDARAAGTFKNFGFQDNGDEVTTTVDPPVSQNGIRVYPPIQSNFVIDFEPGFRGTTQPATAYSETEGTTGSFIGGRVFFVGTRFNAPNTTYAPPVPPYPCRSSFDSIIYPLGAESGLSAYQIASGNNYVIFQDSRLAAISTEASPVGSQLAKDEGLSKTSEPIQPPPPMGLAPTTQATQNIVPVSGQGIPQPAVRFGSTVCQ